MTARSDRILFTCLILDLLARRVALDDISISVVTHTGPMIAGVQYELQCDIQSVTDSVDVRWYKEGQNIKNEIISSGSMTPVNKTSKLWIRPNKTDDGAQYWCEAELNTEGLLLHSKISSKPLNITVHFEPVINGTKLPSTVPVFRGYTDILVCEAEGNPTPVIHWMNKTNGIISINETLSISESTPDIVICIANNTVNSTRREVQVVLKGISISAVKHTGPMIAGFQYELQCHIQSVTDSVDVRWYKEGLNIKNETISSGSIITPVNKTSKLWIRPNKTDDGAQYKCEAVLKRGLPPYLTMSSEPLNITVHFEPVINGTKLPFTVPVFRGYTDILVCEAEGNPTPVIQWMNKDNANISGNGILSLTEFTTGILICIANNSVGNTSRGVQVVLKEDYLPLIAGLVAITVAFISVIFVFIYSIYYKTAKMGRYSLKDAKPSTQNGDIAQNGKDMPLPMKKLSQINILA